MKDLEDLELKAELDEIMRQVDAIMKNVEQVVPAQNKPSDASDVNP
jgi:hypothetical protein